MLNGIFDDLPGLRQPDPMDQEASLLYQIEAIKQKMKLAEELFDLSNDDALTDACIYQLKALGSYYRYLLGEARRTGCHSAAGHQPAKAGMMKAAGLL